MVDASKQSSNPAILLLFGSENVKMRVDEAELVHHQISLQNGNAIGIFLQKIQTLTFSFLNLFLNNNHQTISIKYRYIV